MQGSFFFFSFYKLQTQPTSLLNHFLLNITAFHLLSERSYSVCFDQFLGWLVLFSRYHVQSHAYWGGGEHSGFGVPPTCQLHFRQYWWRYLLNPSNGPRGSGVIFTVGHREKLADQPEATWLLSGRTRVRMPLCLAPGSHVLTLLHPFPSLVTRGVCSQLITKPNHRFLELLL